MAQIEIKNLTFTYNGASGPALDGINLCIERGSFVLLCGSSGCGKTTLLRMLKKQLRPCGKMTGGVYYSRGGITAEEINRLDDRTAAADFGFVTQQPSEGFVSDDIRSELAFGPECLGLDPALIRRRIAEICCFFGIGRLYGRRLSELSGGERQLVKLAAVSVCDPSVLLLDEPTSQLDPVAAVSFLSSLRRLCDEEGVTVIIAEQRLGDVLPLADRAVLMDHGHVVFCGTPGQTVRAAQNCGHPLCGSFPCSARIYGALGKNEKTPCPLTVREGISFLSQLPAENTGVRVEIPRFTDTVLEIRGGYFAYSKDGPDVLRGTDLAAHRGEILAVLGANGSGKSTLLGVLSRTNRLYRGKYLINGKKAEAYKGLTPCLPQDPKLIFTCDTVKEDLMQSVRIAGGEEELIRMAEDFGISALLDRHPYDLSGGEMQKAALCRILLLHPEILLLDEPTKGLDAAGKKLLGRTLQKLAGGGCCTVLVTHDAEFAALYAHTCVMHFDGQNVCEAPSREFFRGGRYYTTAASRIASPLGLDAVTDEELIGIFKKSHSSP